MTGAGAKDKGSAFERLVCRLLSEWLSFGQRKDLFTRNVLSGGAFTVAAAKNQKFGNPGDVSASHPLAHAFCEKYLVEAKHWRNLGLDTALWHMDAGDLRKAIIKAKKQSDQSDRGLLFVARQNNRPTLLFTPMSLEPRVPFYHLLWSGEICCCLFDDFLKLNPSIFLPERVRIRRPG